MRQDGVRPLPDQGHPASIKHFSGGAEMAQATDPTNGVAEPSVGGVPVEESQPELTTGQPSWPRRLVGAYAEVVTASSDFAGHVGKLALSGNLREAIKTAIGWR